MCGFALCFVRGVRVLLACAASLLHCGRPKHRDILHVRHRSVLIVVCVRAASLLLCGRSKRREMSHALFQCQHFQRVGWNSFLSVISWMIP